MFLLDLLDFVAGYLIFLLVRKREKKQEWFGKNNYSCRFRSCLLPRASGSFGSKI